VPHAPLPPELQRFVAKPRHAVVGTVRADGTPVTYKIAENAAMPADLAVGKVVTIRSIPGSGLRIIVEK